MTYREYREKTDSVPETSGLEMKQAFLWFHPQILPVGVASLNGKTDQVIKIPRKFVNAYGREVSVVRFSTKTFCGNENVTDVILHNAIFTINDGSFSGCKNLKRITIPRRVKRIGRDTFAGCNALEDVYYEGSYEEYYT